MSEIITPNSLEKMFGEINRRIDGLATGYSGIQPTADTGVANAATAQTTANSAITIVGTKNTAFYSASAPTANAVNDIWFDSSNGNKLMQWNGSAWASVQDVAIATAQSASTAAASAATAAQTTANGKNAVFRQSTTPTALGVGDVWFNTANDNSISRWDGTSWVANSLGNNAIASLSASKLTAGTIDASIITVSNINAGNISAGYIASARIAAGTISVSQLVAGTLAAGNITTGTLTASVIYTGSISATQIIAGNLVGFDINNGTGTFHVDSSGNLTASSATITGTVTSSNLTATGGTIAGFAISGSGLSSAGSTVVINNSGTVNCTQLLAGTSGITSTGTMNANGLLYNSGHASTTSAANVFMNAGSGLIALVTSARRFKVEIKRESIPLKSVMALKPKSWVDKTAYKENGNSSKGLPRILGLVAEDVAKIPVLKDLLVNYDKKGKPHSVNYDRIAIALIELVQELQIRVTQLEAEL